jgi:hypothetical protein
MYTRSIASKQLVIMTCTARVKWINLRNYLRCMIVPKDEHDANLAGVSITGCFASQCSNGDRQMVMVEISYHTGL